MGIRDSCFREWAAKKAGKIKTNLKGESRKEEAENGRCRQEA
jgi:hypothetical protein